jgi:flagellar export protein FliJ
MAIFRFRAAAALEVRRRQEDDALAECTRKDGLKRAADAKCAELEARRQDAGRALMDSQQQGQDSGTQGWHRNWITGLSAAALVAARDAAQAAEAVGHARRVWQEARKKRLVLERLRDRAWRRFRHEETRREQLVIDELARVRFTTRALAEGSWK